MAAPQGRGLDASGAGHMTTGQVETSLNHAVSQLSSTKPSTVYGALVAIRKKFLKEKDGYKRLIRYGGLEKLTVLVENFSKHSSKTLDVLLSIIANCAMVTDAQIKMNELGLPSIIGSIIMSPANQSIQNRAVRSLANLAQLPEASCSIHMVPGLVNAVVKLLSDSDDAGCQETYSRAIRLWSNNKAHMLLMLQAEAVDVLFQLLSSTQTSVLNAALKSITHFLHVYQSVSHLSGDCLREHASNDTSDDEDMSQSDNAALNLISSVMAKRSEPITTKRIEDEITRCIARCEGLKALLTLSSSEDISISTAASGHLLRAVSNQALRPLFGNAGGIPWLVDCLSKTRQLRYANSLCLCCQEALNRVRVREEGLLVLLESLSDTHFSKIHNRIVSALVCFVYDEVGLGMLLKQGLCLKLAKHLSTVSGVYETVKDLKSNETEPDTTDVVSSTAGKKSGDSLNRNCDDNEIETAKASTSRHVTSRPQSVTYSMHSPTYQELSQSSTAAAYDSDGPTNLWDFGGQANSMFGPAGSPVESSASYSPLSTSSYNSPQWLHMSPPASPASTSGLTDSTIFPTPPVVNSPQSYRSSSPGLPLTPPTPLSSAPLSPLLFSPQRDDEALHELDEAEWLDNPYSEDLFSGDGLIKNPEEVEGLLPKSLHEDRSEKTNLETSTLKRSHSFTEGLEYKRLCKRSSPEPFSPVLNTSQLTAQSDVAEKDISIDPRVHKHPGRLTEHNILVLLSRVSHLDDPSLFLVQPQVLNPLLNYIAKSRRPLTRAKRILERITSHRHCFLDVIQQRLPVIIHQTLSGGDASLSAVRDSLLGNLSVTMESKYGRGSVVRLLMSADESVRRNAALSLPFISRNTSQMKWMLLQLNSLDLIMDCLQSESLVSSALYCLTHLISLHSHISLPAPPALALMTSSESTANVSKDVVFELDGGRHVSGNRELLMTRSEVFRAMLTGDFKEKNQDVIPLPNVQEEAFQNVIELIHNPGWDLDLSLNVLLDMLALVDQFLLGDVQLRIAKAISCMMTVNDNTLVIQTSVCHNSPWLLKHSLYFLMTASISDSLKLSLFSELLDWERCDEVLSGLKDLYRGLTS